MNTVTVNEHDEVEIYQLAPVVSRMKITGVALDCCEPPPGRWYRFWQRVVLGITWEDLR